MKMARCWSIHNTKRSSTDEALVVLASHLTWSLVRVVWLNQRPCGQFLLGGIFCSMGRHAGYLMYFAQNGMDAARYRASSVWVVQKPESCPWM